MAILNRSIVQGYGQTYGSRYRYMKNSSDVVDRANAEVYRLASNLMQGIANDMIRSDGLPGDLSPYIDDLREGWSKFCTTGIIDDEAQELSNEHTATLVKAEGSPSSPHAPRRPRLERELREYVNHRAIETVAAEISTVLGLPYVDPSPPQDGFTTSGLVRHDPGKIQESASTEENAQAEQKEAATPAPSREKRRNVAATT